MHLKKLKFRIGLRTIKTSLAVTISMIVVDFFGATTSKLIFATLGALAAVQPTFNESLDSCLTQIAGVLFGAFMGIFLLWFSFNPLLAAGIGIIMVITLYNALHIRFSPVLSCIIVVTLCTTPGISPYNYACGRIWDSTIGLIVGMLINTLVFPYDNSRCIRRMVESLDVEVIHFLEDMFDGDDILPNAERMQQTIKDLDDQLHTFANQRLIHRLRKQYSELETYRLCERKAKELVARMEVLSLMGIPGRLNEENRTSLETVGAEIRDKRILIHPEERDIITNYHVRQILQIRRDLLDALSR